ncbi:hypothetical protein ABZU92_03760 [Micromonospora arida]|uniref:hypothetical protein n=1 Tax=Micromonospora TaxID=1873 RepID=UPI002E23899C
MNTVKKPLTPNLPRQRRRDVVENDQFAGFAKRIIRAHGRRVATGDVEALRDLIALSSVIDDAIGEAVIGLRTFGYSWAEIGQRLGISRQAAQQRWGDKP